MKKVCLAVLPALTIVLELLPLGAVCIFATSPTERVKETFNTDKCIDIIKKNKLNWLLKETVDEEKLENDIYNGTVDASLFQDAIETTHTFAVTFKKNKNK